MRIKKKRKDPKGNRIRLKGLLLFLSVILGCSLAAGLFYLLKPENNFSPPIFEEVYLTPPILTNHLTRVDHLIYEALYINGTEEGDVIFSAVKPMHNEKDYWDFTELLIKQTDIESIYRLKEIITSKLSEFGSIVNFKMEDISDKKVVCHISIKGLYTHRIEITYDGEAKKAIIPYPKIAIIIDDLGYDKKMADAVIDVDLPLSLSVLPYAPFTEYVTELARKGERDILLHLPLEPKNYPRVNPGPGTLLTSMEDDEIRQRIDSIIKQTPGISGVNHHMGSNFTENYNKMSIVLDEIKKRGLYYVDSRTTAQTVAYDIAKKMGVPVAKKSLFLDHDFTMRAIKYQMERLLSMARYSGSAVGIGHPHHETLKVLTEYKDKLEKEFRVVPVSYLVN